MLRRVSGPASEPVTTAEAKAHLRVDLDDDDALIDGLVAAARQYCEQAISRSFLETTWDLTLSAFPAWGVTTERAASGRLVYPATSTPLERLTAGRIDLPIADLRSVASITYLDAAGDTRTLDPSAYRVVTGAPGRIVPAYGTAWPAHRIYDEAVTVRFVAGYGADAASVPDCVKHAIKLLVGHWYVNREAVVLTGAVPQELLFSVQALLSAEGWGAY